MFDLTPFTLKEWRLVCTLLMWVGVIILNPLLFCVAWLLRPSKAAVAEEQNNL